MAIPDIDQIKRSEEEATYLIEAARHRKTLAIEEAKQAGENLFFIRLSDAEKRLREEREQAEKEVANEHIRLIAEAQKEASHIREEAEKQKKLAVQVLVRLITGV